MNNLLVKLEEIRYINVVGVEGLVTGGGAGVGLCNDDMIYVLLFVSKSNFKNKSSSLLHLLLYEIRRYATLFKLISHQNRIRFNLRKPFSSSSRPLQERGL